MAITVLENIRVFLVASSLTSYEEPSTKCCLLSETQVPRKVGWEQNCTLLWLGIFTELFCFYETLNLFTLKYFICRTYLSFTNQLNVRWFHKTFQWYFVAQSAINYSFFHLQSKLESRHFYIWRCAFQLIYCRIGIRTP